MPDHLEPFHLTNNDANLTVVDGTANSWTDIWKFQVPRGTEIVLAPGDTLSTYLEDDSPAEVEDRTCRVKIEIRDPAEGEVFLVYGPYHYLRSKEFQDDDLKARLRMLEPFRVPARYWVALSVYDDGAIDESDSAFDLYIHRARAGVAAG